VYASTSRSRFAAIGRQNVHSGTCPHSDLTVPHTPLALAVGGGAIWIADYGERKVIKVDPHTSEVFARIGVGGHPWGVAVAGGRVFVGVD